MKKVFLFAMVSAMLMLGSCTDNTDELVEKELNENKELFGINKEDIDDPDGSEEEPDFTED